MCVYVLALAESTSLPNGVPAANGHIGGGKPGGLIPNGIPSSKVVPCPSTPEKPLANGVPNGHATPVQENNPFIGYIIAMHRKMVSKRYCELWQGDGFTQCSLSIVRVLAQMKASNETKKGLHTEKATHQYVSLQINTLAARCKAFLFHLKQYFEAQSTFANRDTQTGLSFDSEGNVLHRNVGHYPCTTIKQKEKEDLSASVISARVVLKWTSSQMPTIMVCDHQEVLSACDIPFLTETDALNIIKVIIESGTQNPAHLPFHMYLQSMNASHNFRPLTGNLKYLRKVQVADTL